MNPRALINGIAIAIPLWVLGILGAIHIAATAGRLVAEAERAVLIAEAGRP